MVIKLVNQEVNKITSFRILSSLGDKIMKYVTVDTKHRNLNSTVMQVKLKHINLLFVVDWTS